MRYEYTYLSFRGFQAGTTPPQVTVRGLKFSIYAVREVDGLYYLNRDDQLRGCSAKSRFSHSAAQICRYSEIKICYFVHPPMTLNPVEYRFMFSFYCNYLR